LDKLNRLLWLKCKINSRLALGTKHQSLFMVFLFVTAFAFSTIPFTLAVISSFLSWPSTSVRELIHLLFTAVYIFWLVFPILGYRQSGIGDFTGLLIYPLSPVTLIIAGITGSFLDAPFLLFLPILVIPLFLFMGTFFGMLWTVLIVFLFLVHAISFGQLIIVLLRKTLGGGSFFRNLSKVIPWIGLIMLWGSQNFISYYWFGRELPSNPGLSFVTLLFPSGVAAEAIHLFYTGQSSAGYYGLILLVISLCSVSLTYLVSEGYMSGRYLGSQSSLDKKFSETFINRAFMRVLSLPLKKNNLLPLLAKDLNLLLREPQYRALWVMFAVLLVVMAVGFAIIPGEEAKAARLVTLFFFPGLIFSMGSASLNSLAMERRGLGYILQLPVSHLEVLLSKAIVFLHVQFIFLIYCLFLFVLAGAINLRQAFYALVGGMCLSMVMVGFNQVVSVLTPIPLPAGGVVQPNPPGPSRVMYLSLAASIAIFFTCALTSPVIVVLIALYFGDNYWLWIVSLPVFFLYIPGIGAFGLYFGSLLFKRRQEKLVVEVVE
jgi:hypothetical protein